MPQVSVPRHVPGSWTRPHSSLPPPACIDSTRISADVPAAGETPYALCAWHAHARCSSSYVIRLACGTRASGAGGGDVKAARAPPRRRRPPAPAGNTPGDRRRPQVVHGPSRGRPRVSVALSADPSRRGLGSHYLARIALSVEAQTVSAARPVSTAERSPSPPGSAKEEACASWAGR